MTRWVLLPSFRPGADRAEVASWLDAARALEDDSPQVALSDVDADIEPSVGGGDASWDLTSVVPPENLPGFVALTEPGRGPLAACPRVALETVAAGVDSFEGHRVKRTLLLTVRLGTRQDDVEGLEASLAAMGERVPGIRSWCLSRVDQARSEGPWTHAWEQEFAHLDDLLRGYMRDDYHLTAVDRWFNPEVPGHVVETAVAQLVRRAARPLLAESIGGADHLVG